MDCLCCNVASWAACACIPNGPGQVLRTIEGWAGIVYVYGTESRSRAPRKPPAPACLFILDAIAVVRALRRDTALRPRVFHCAALPPDVLPWRLPPNRIPLNFSARQHVPSPVQISWRRSRLSTRWIRKRRNVAAKVRGTIVDFFYQLDKV
jgi:hypothetical protein